jgi:peroxiredoxin
MPSDLKPSMPAPSLSFDTIGKGRWSLAETHPRALDLIAFYRGNFCPYCKDFISSLEARAPAFLERGIDLTAISMDPVDLADRSVSDWQLKSLVVGYGLDLQAARAWRLFVTSRASGQGTSTFCEPALMLITPDKRVYAMVLQSIPSGRPDLDNFLKGLDFLAEHGYPVRGAF